MSEYSMEQINRGIAAKREAWLRELSLLVAQKSVSGTGEGVEECAALFVRSLEAAGITARVIYPGDDSGAFPFVVGETKDAPENAPTVLVYGHYDTQPEGDLSLWDSPPYEPQIRNGRMYGRGISDNKCQIFFYIKAIELCRELTGSLPCRVKFIFEGSEEIGSPGLHAFLRSHRELLRADICLNSDGAIHESCRPTLKLGTKGMYAPTLSVTCANREVHSMHGPTVPSAAWRMIAFLHSLKELTTGRVLIDGFYDDVLPPTREELATLSSMPNDGETTLRELGLSHFAPGPHGDDYNYNFVFEPSCNINSLNSGYTGPGENNVVPNKARVRLDFRLVPNQTPEDIHEKLKAHLQAHGFTDFAFENDGIVGRPYRLSVENPYVRVIVDALRESFGAEPIVYPNGGGSGPLKLFAEALDIDILILPLCAADQCEHAPNENMKLSDFDNGIRAAATMLLRLGERRQA